MEKIITCPRPNETAKLRLFCFPYAGVGPSMYYPWLNLLPADIELNMIHLPGRETRLREPAYRQFQPLVLDLEQEILPLTNKPFVFFGYSLGATIAYELSRQLERKGGALPKCLFVASRRAPHLPDNLPHLSALSDHDFLTEVQKRYNGVPAQILEDPELLSIFLPVIRADFELLESYRYHPEPPQAIPIIVFGGDQDKFTTVDHLEAWRDHTCSTFTVRLFSGGHFFIQQHRSDLVAEVIRHIS